MFLLGGFSDRFHGRAQPPSNSELTVKHLLVSSRQPACGTCSRQLGISSKPLLASNFLTALAAAWEKWSNPCLGLQLVLFLFVPTTSIWVFWCFLPVREVTRLPSNSAAEREPSSDLPNLHPSRLRGSSGWTNAKWSFQCQLVHEKASKGSWKWTVMLHVVVV